MKPTRWCGFVAALFALNVAGWVAEARAAIVIDDFSSAVNTILITDTNVAVFAAGATNVATDTGLPDVLGGSRELTVHAEFSCCFIPGLDNVVVGVVPLAGFLDCNSTAQADGQTALLYDGGGLGLHANFATATGIRLLTLDADLAAVPIDVVMTLVDQDGHSASVLRTVFLAGTTPQIEFPFAEFPGVNIEDVFSIDVAIDPSSSGAADLRLDRIETYNSSAAQAPLLSLRLLAVVVSSLLLSGLYGLRRQGT